MIQKLQFPRSESEIELIVLNNKENLLFQKSWIEIQDL